MKTISSIDLRNNLNDIVKRVRAGETIHVTYRSKPAFTIQPDPSLLETRPGSIAAMKEVSRQIEELNKKSRVSQLDPHKSTKELSREMTDANSKYQGSHA